MRLLWLLAMTVFANVLADDNFKILRDDVAGFSQVTPNRLFKFPADHASHPDYRIEWWYLTANLTDSQDRHWGLQWTLFRQSLSPFHHHKGWSSNQLWMAHAAITTPNGHHYEQRFARGGIGQAGVNLDHQFEAWIDDWVWRADTSSLFPSNLSFGVGEHQIDMQLDSSADWVLQGDAGYSQKSAQGQASYYYSQPKIKIKGSIDGEKLTGSAWLDREWSSQPLAPNQRGWDWFSIHLDDGHKLMLYQLRHDDGTHWLSGSWIDAASDKTKHLTDGEIRLKAEGFRDVKTSDNTPISLPLDWSIDLPKLNRQFRIKPLYDQQWMGARFPYWEGVVLVEDSDGKAIGKGYMELTGYE